MAQVGKRTGGQVLATDNTMTKRGFSMVELLVVVAIIVALVGILLPSLSDAFAETQKAVCMAKLKQMHMAGNMYAVPGEDAITIEGETPHAAQLLITSAAQIDGVTLTIGSANGTTGRYVAVIDGFAIGQRDQDMIRIGQGPLAATEPLVVYMVAGEGTRLDPALRLLTDTGDDEGIACDDAGRRGCEGVPSPVGLSFQFADPSDRIEADRFDAGVTLPPGPPQLRNLELSSFRDNTTGRYALVLLGALPQKD